MLLSNRPLWPPAVAPAMGHFRTTALQNKVSRTTSPFASSGHQRLSTRKEIPRDVALTNIATRSRQRSELQNHPQFRFEVVDWVVFDDGHTGFQRHGHAVVDFPTNSDVKREEEMAGLTGN
jgi:hypothetical protein